MAFKPVTANTHRGPFVTILARRGQERGLTLSVASLRAIGEPRAIAFEWDDDASLLRISAASPESPEASRLPSTMSHGVTVTALLRELGVSFPGTTRLAATPDGPLAIIADLSEYRSAA